MLSRRKLSHVLTAVLVGGLFSAAGAGALAGPLDDLKRDVAGPAVSTRIHALKQVARMGASAAPLRPVLVDRLDKEADLNAYTELARALAAIGARDVLANEVMALDQMIRFYDDQNRSLEQSARELDQLARQASQDNLLTSVAMFAAQARAFRTEVGENLRRKGEAAQKKAVIEAVLRFPS